MTQAFRIILIKPSKYDINGYVERFRRGFMPNSTLLHIKSLTPADVDGRPIVVEVIDEYVESQTHYLKRLNAEQCSLLALVGVQSHQMHRALDLAAYAKSHGVPNCIIGGPHVMTCDTSEVHGRGISFALAEGELIWHKIVNDAMSGELQNTYGQEQRWQSQLTSPPMLPPEKSSLKKYIIPMVGLYPARGCPYSCNFCSVIKIAGKQVRSQPVQTTIESMIAAKKAGVRLVMFTSDNFNKYAQARELLNSLIEQKVNLPFFVQCDVQLSRDEELIALLVRAGCAQVFVGVESFNRDILKAVGKYQNHPQKYIDLVKLCHRYGLSTHFSNIIGFPEQNEAAILEHIDVLRSVRPFMASFYILTHIPGTDQYDEYRQKKLITETNLDRFDATCSVWKHPQLSKAHLEKLLCKAYSQFYASKDVVTKLLGQQWSAPWFVHGLGFSYAAFARYSAWKGQHPMAGGIGTLKRDHVNDYLPYRKKIYGIQQLALPDSLQLSNQQDKKLYEIKMMPKVS